MASKQKLKNILGVLALSSLAFTGCKGAKPKKSSGTDTSPTPLPSDMPATGDTLTFSVTGGSGTSLFVQLNQSYTWAFSATASDGSAATVSRVVPATTPAGMQVSANQVTFSPKTEAELNGSLTVYGSRSGGQEQSQIFYWAKDPNSSATTNCPTALLTQAMVLIPSLIQNKKFDLASITAALPTVLQACAANLLPFLGGGSNP